MTPAVSRSDQSPSGWGPVALLANGILLYVILAWLAHSAPNPSDRTLLLAMGNLGLACALLVPVFRGEPLLPDRKTGLALLGWSLAYSLIYGTFVVIPELVPVWGLIAVQACAPLIAVFVSGDHHREPIDSFPCRVIQSSPIVFLLGIARFEWKSSEHAVISPVLALVLVSLFIFSQACARLVARYAPSARWGPPRLALLNGILLLAFWVVVERGVNGSGWNLLPSAALLSAGIFALQALYLFALAKTPPFLSALLLGAAVPISLFGDSITRKGPSHPILSTWLGVGFSLAMGIVTWATRRVWSDTSNRLLVPALDESTTRKDV
jgi:hypothetical protein